MRVGIPLEIKPQEHRVGLTPEGVRELVNLGHEVVVQSGLGDSIGFGDQSYLKSGARVVTTPNAVFAESELIVKVKEPQPQECKLLTENHTLFTYLHLAPDPIQAQLLCDSGATCIAYETVENITGALPLLTPMSEVAGRLSIQAAARCLEKHAGGSGVLLGGVPGVPAAELTVLGGGVVGLNAARMALGAGARVTIVDKSLERLRYIDDVFGGHIATVFSTEESIHELLVKSDCVIGAVLVRGAKAPRLIRKDHLGLMKPGSVIVDVAIDQGGCFETSRPTTHMNPTYIEDGIVHYCVANMPGAVARTSSYALSNATLPYIVALSGGVKAALRHDSGFLSGANVIAGHIVHPAVADALNSPYVDPKKFI